MVGCQVHAELSLIEVLMISDTSFSYHFNLIINLSQAFKLVEGICHIQLFVLYSDLDHGLSTLGGQL